MSKSKSKSTETPATNGTGRAVIVFTARKGVFFGYADDTTGDRIFLRRARMAIYWGTTKGVFELAETGPTKSSKISSQADMDVREITGVLEVSPAALAVWEALT
jgi:hypothetical protein